MYNLFSHLFIFYLCLSLSMSLFISQTLTISVLIFSSSFSEYIWYFIVKLNWRIHSVEFFHFPLIGKFIYDIVGVFKAYELYNV